jgi:PBP1b-binding outer membrane lipoprotein LpoB
MKSLITHLPLKWIVFAFISIFIFSGCRKQIDQPLVQDPTVADNSAHGHLKQTNSYSSEVVVKWMAMQLRLTQATTGANPFGANPTRFFAYNGIALYESVVHGMLFKRFPVS